MKNDIPDGFESLLGGFWCPDSTKPIIPQKWMTTEQLLKCIEHNARIIAKQKEAENETKKTHA